MSSNKTKNYNYKNFCNNVDIKSSLLQNNHLTDEELRVRKKPKLSCSANQNNACVHEWITDLIDIDPDRSRQITYCKHCEVTKS